MRERRNGQRLYDTLVDEGFAGSYPMLQRAVRTWNAEREHAGGRVFVPLVFAPGEAFQFDWSYETVELGGQVQPVKVAYLRLAHSRAFLADALDEGKPSIYICSTHYPNHDPDL